MNNINIDLAKEKGLISDNDYLYQDLSKKYKYYLEYYLNSLIDFSKYDSDIKNSNLYIGINPKYKSLNEYLNLNYIFFINYLFIEKLSLEDLNLLKESNKEINDEIINMVSKTYKDVILNNYHHDKYVDLIYKISYGNPVPNNFVNNNSLVFKIYYGKNLIDVHRGEFFKLNQDQIDFINKVSSELIKEVKEKTNIPCEVLVEKDIY